MNEISIFDFEESSIRTLTLNDQPYFVGKDIAVALGYSNTNDALKRHCRGVVKHDLIDKLGREQETTVIPEPDLYRLIFNSKLPAAEKFESWVTEEVLPSLRQHGSYSLPEEAATTQEYDINNIQVAEFELRAVKAICMLFGRNAGKQAYLASKLLPKPEAIILSNPTYNATDCLQRLKSLSFSGQTLPQAIKDKSDLRQYGIEITDNEIILATSGQTLNAHFAGSSGEKNWINALLELPGCEKPDKVKRFGTITSRYITLPLFYFGEKTNVQ